MSGHTKLIVFALSSTLLVVVSWGPFGAALAMGAAPKAVTYADSLRLRQRSVVTHDWSDTQAFDLENPIQLEVVIRRVDVQQRGYVILYYDLETPVLPDDDKPDVATVTYSALLQTQGEVERLEIPLGMLKKGVSATLLGWPETERNYYGASMLVDEIRLQRGGSRMEFHKENSALRDHVNGGRKETSGN